MNAEGQILSDNYRQFNVGVDLRLPLRPGLALQAGGNHFILHRPFVQWLHDNRLEVAPGLTPIRIRARNLPAAVLQIILPLLGPEEKYLQTLMRNSCWREQTNFITDLTFKLNPQANRAPGSEFEINSPPWLNISHMHHIRANLGDRFQARVSWAPLLRKVSTANDGLGLRHALDEMLEHRARACAWHTQKWELSERLAELFFV